MRFDTIRIFALFLLVTIGCQQDVSDSVGERDEIDHPKDAVSSADSEVENSVEKHGLDNAVEPDPPPRFTSDGSARELNSKESVSQVSTTTSRSIASKSDRVFQELVAARRDSNPEKWEQAEKQLEELGKNAVPVLVNALKSTDVEVRELAAMWLVRLGPDAQGAEVQLAEVLDDESAFVRVNAASALSHLPDYAARVVPILAELLAHGEFSVRITATTALGNAGQHAGPAVPALVDALVADEEEMQIAVLTTLGRIGASAHDALKPVRQMWQTTKSETVKKAAEEAFRLIKGESK
ncbi:MAG: HEAT repeat domain-containing protein [Planctomycetaceae bacterium]